MARDRQLSAGFETTRTISHALLERPSRRTLEPLLVSALLAMSLHAALLSVPVRGEAAGTVGARPEVMPFTSQRILSRLIEKNAGEANERSVRGGANTEPRRSTPLREARNHDVSPSPPLPSPSVAKPLSPATGLVALRLPGVLGDDDFFPRQALDLPPHPTSPVLIEYPSAEENSGTHASELTLFIDDKGKVVRIRVDGPALPIAMEAAARAAFMGATFAPGQVDGLAVRSKIRVEVLFEETSQRH